MVGKRHRRSLALMLLLLAATLLILLRSWDREAVLAALRGVRPGWLALGGVCMAAFLGCEAACTWLALRAMGHPTPYGRCFLASVSGFYFSSVTPSSTGGQPAQVYYLDRMGVPAAYGALDMLLITVCWQVVSVLYALTAWLAAPGLTASLGTGLGVLLGYGATATTLLTAVVLVLLLRPAPAERVCRWLIALGARLGLLRDRAGCEARLERQLTEYRAGASLLRRRPGLFPKLLALTAAQLTCSYLVPWTVYRALGLTGVSAVELVSTQALLALAVGALPIPGAVGASEAAFLTAYRQLFAPMTEGAMLLSRGLSFYLPLVLTGLGVLLLHRATRREEPAAERS